MLQAIVESNPFGLTLKDMRKGEELGNDFAKELGCDSVECLYSKVCEHVELKAYVWLLSGIFFLTDAELDRDS